MFHKERAVFRHVWASRLQNVYCLNLVFHPHRKNDISSYISPRSSIQTAKCSLLEEKIVYQSFYGASLTFSYFYFKEKFCVSAVASASHLRDVYCLKFSEDLVQKITSGYI